ncbi:SDR family NAD(P)-dependent oxidoreductase [Rhizobium sp.]
MSKEFNGKVIIVTGGGSGIGAATARALAAEGAKVIVADMNGDHARALASDIKGKGGEATAHVADVSDPTAVEAMVAFAVSTYGKLDGAVNNAGIGGPQKPIADYGIEEWRKVIDVDLNSVFYCLKYEIAAMEKTGGGAIVNVASILGTNGFANSSAYVTSKHGVVGLTKNAGIEYSAKGIRVNAVGPGFINTPLVNSSLDAEKQAFLVDKHPIGRLGESDEVANLIVFLLSDKASFITGSYHLVDGAYAAQ